MLKFFRVEFSILRLIFLLECSSHVPDINVGILKNNNLGNTGNNLSTSILDYALTLEKGLYSVSLSGGNYTGADLPNTTYAYSSALINVRKKGEAVSVMLFGISTKQPLAVNSKDDGAWLGWAGNSMSQRMI